MSDKKSDKQKLEKTPLAKRKRKNSYESLFKAMVLHSADVVLLLEAGGKVRFCSPSSLATLGRSPDQIEKKNFFSMMDEKTAKEQRAMYLSNIFAGKPSFTSTFNIKNSDNKDIHLEAQLSNYLNNPSIKGVLLTLRDATRQKEAEEKAFFYEYYDPLTKLPNKESFLIKTEAYVSIAKNRGKSFGVMVLGLDAFKSINDEYGTHEGDEILKQVAAALSSSFRGDDVVARYRSDKFLVLFADLKSRDNIQELIQKTGNVFNQEYSLKLGQKIKLSASMGMAFYPNDGTDAETLLHKAESALYTAKTAGKNNYRLFDAKLNKDLLSRQRMERELVNAIAEDSFEPYFQAKVDYTGHIIGAEALVRWRLPSGKIRYPADFIELAESSGNMDSISEAIINKTCRYIALWTELGLSDIPVSINLSPNQFASQDFIEKIIAIVKSYNVNPYKLEFEITESGIMSNEKDSIEKLFMLKDFGASVAIDDFGTGYSSFSKLKDYPVDTLKMDRSFVSPLPNDRKASIIASAIIDLAHTLSFSVVAEGVETKGQMDFLDTIFCDQFQGFLFSRPIPENQFRNILTKGLPLMETKNLTNPKRMSTHKNTNALD